MKLMLRYIWRYKRYLPLSLIGVVGFILIQMGLPTLLKYIINDALMKSKFDLLLQIVLIMLAIIVVGCLAQICMSYANSRIASNVIRDIRGDVFKKTQSFSHAEFESFGVPALITSTTSDAYQIMIFIQTLLRSALITPFMTISGFVLILTHNPSMLWVVLVATPLLILGVILISKMSHPYSVKQQKAQDDINLILREGVTGMRVIRAFGNENFQNSRFKTVNDEYCGVSKRLFRITAFAQPGFYLLFNFMIIIVLWMGSSEIGQGTMDIGTLNASIDYIFHILFSFMMLAVLFIMYPRVSVSVARIDKILKTATTVPENLDIPNRPKQRSGSITFEDVSFYYPGDVKEPVIEHVNFTASPGQTVAFIGSTGSGKSTLVQLIPRIYDVTSGRILLNGCDVREYNIHDLRQRIGYIPQKAQLFSGSIEYNLRFSQADLTLDDLKQSANIAQASDFIEEKELGYGEKLSEGGGNLSGGQRQRLSITRAIAKKPEIYVFDDSFSALDYATDLKLRLAIREQIKDATILIVAQRIGTIRHADKILVLDNGKVVGEGTHQELMDNCGVYYDIAVSQLSQEELG